MDKQELIDTVVTQRKGKWLGGEYDRICSVSDGKHCFIMKGFNLHNDDVFCTREEFDQRARELGFVNGFEWGKEYPTNGKKPDLPDDVLIRIASEFNGHLTWSGSAFVQHWVWDSPHIKKFRIVDDRFKPNVTFIADQVTIVNEATGKKVSIAKAPEDEGLNARGEIAELADSIRDGFSEPINDNSWHERGDLPPAGVKCEAKLNGEWMPVFVVGKNSKGYLVFEPLFDWGFSYDSYGNDALNFRPIKSDRERFIDAALDGFDKVSDEFPPAKNDWLKKLFGGMFDAGFRAPLDKG